MIIAAAHPGKLGDAMWSLPTIKWLCIQNNCQADFYTSPYCQPLARLFEYQSYIRNVFIVEDFETINSSQGIQPWNVNVPNNQYDKIFQLGFQSFPDCQLGDFIAKGVGAPKNLPVVYDTPEVETLKEPYYVLAPRDPDRWPFAEFIEKVDCPVVQIGAKGQCIEGMGIDLTGLDILETTTWIKNSIGFIGETSSQLVLASGFEIPKVVCVSPGGVCESHLGMSLGTFYVDAKTVNDLIYPFGQNRVYSSTLNTDYSGMTEIQHIHNIRNKLGNIKHRFEHKYREWEYGLSIHALRTKDVKTVLDVGGGGSAFGPALAYLGAIVTEIDPGGCSDWVGEQAKAIGVTSNKLKYIQKTFPDNIEDLEESYDAVTCLSVIEHVEDHLQFFDRLLDFVKENGLLVLTTDFHFSGEARLDGHLRTYNEKSLYELINLALRKGFLPYRSRIDYSSREENVNNYTFASLILEKQKS